jgi:hypothetical protein
MNSVPSSDAQCCANLSGSGHRMELARIVPHALMIEFLISRFITTNQYDKVCVAFLWAGGWV